MNPQISLLNSQNEDEDEFNEEIENEDGEKSLLRNMVSLRFTTSYHEVMASASSLLESFFNKRTFCYSFKLNF